MEGGGSVPLSPFCVCCCALKLSRKVLRALSDVATGGHRRTELAPLATRSAGGAAADECRGRHCKLSPAWRHDHPLSRHKICDL